MAAEPISARKSQLLMRRSLREPLPEVGSLPDGYTIRLFTEGEVTALTEVLEDAFPEIGWNAAKTRSELVDAPDVEAIYVVEFQGRPVATASVRYLPDRFPGAGIVHWVGVSAGHRGRGLGMMLTRRVCEHFIEDGYGVVILETDDFRAPAIKNYLRLGFRPLLRDETHPARWEKILSSLGVTDLT